jgi:hypothetical protein
MRISASVALSAILIIAVMCYTISYYNVYMLSAQSYEDLRQRILNIYSRLAEAERRGADVSSQAELLNKALEMLSGVEGSGVGVGGDVASNVSAILSKIEDEIPALEASGEAAARLKLIVDVAAGAGIALSIATVYLYIPRLIASLWLRLRRGWLVRVVDRR